VKIIGSKVCAASMNNMFSLLFFKLPFPTDASRERNSGKSGESIMFGSSPKISWGGGGEPIIFGSSPKVSRGGGGGEPIIFGSSPNISWGGGGEDVCLLGDDALRGSHFIPERQLFVVLKITKLIKVRNYITRKLVKKLSGI